jgi:hypothetical protein
MRVITDGDNLLDIQVRRQFRTGFQQQAFRK